MDNNNRIFLVSFECSPELPKPVVEKYVRTAVKYFFKERGALRAFDGVNPPANVRVLEVDADTRGGDIDIAAAVSYVQVLDRLGIKAGSSK